MMKERLNEQIYFKISKFLLCFRFSLMSSVNILTVASVRILRYNFQKLIAMPQQFTGQDNNFKILR